MIVSDTMLAIKKSSFLIVTANGTIKFKDGRL